MRTPRPDAKPKASLNENILAWLRLKVVSLSKTDLLIIFARLRIVALNLGESLLSNFSDPSCLGGNLNVTHDTLSFPFRAP